MDEGALTSSQLYSVDYHIDDDDSPGQHSELPSFKKLLLHAKNLKVLKVHMDQSSRYSTPYYADDPLNFQFQPNDQFPALEELTMDCYPRYELTVEHCDLWATCMDWGSLRKLDLDKGCPRHLLAAITGMVPQLKSLAFGFYSNHDVSTWECPDLDMLRRFLVSIQELEDVRIRAWDDTKYAQIRPLLFEKHGKTLKHLSVEYGERDGWAGEDISVLYKHAPHLQSLNTAVHMRQELVSGSGSTLVCSTTQTHSLPNNRLIFL